MEIMVSSIDVRRASLFSLGIGMDENKQRVDFVLYTKDVRDITPGQKIRLERWQYANRKTRG